MARARPARGVGLRGVGRVGLGARRSLGVGRGLSLTLAPAWGNAASAVERLWSLRDPGGLAANDDFEPGARLDAELGYGLKGPRGVGVATPYAGLGLAREDDRAWRAGARWKLAPDFTLGLEATRHEPRPTTRPSTASCSAAPCGGSGRGGRC